MSDTLAVHHLVVFSTLNAAHWLSLRSLTIHLLDFTSHASAHSSRTVDVGDAGILMFVVPGLGLVPALVFTVLDAAFVGQLHSFWTIASLVLGVPGSMSRALTESLVTHVFLMRVFRTLTSSRSVVPNGTILAVLDALFFTVDLRHTNVLVGGLAVLIMSTVVLGWF
jgi:hypothetical protein